MTASPTATPPASRLLRRALPALLLLAVAASAAAPAAISQAPYAQGDEVLFTGVVTNRAGVPIPDLQITLEASRAAFNFRRLGRVRENLRRLATVTDERGEFSLPWRWDDYYNRFDLVLAVPVRTAGGESLHELQRVDLSRRILQGSPVVTSLVVEDTSVIDARRRFLAALDSADERKIYEQMGQPDRLQQVPLPGFEEVTWWYFRQGRAYRFRDGALQQVIPFDPVEPFEP